jgi:penicillin-binding protein-related factor A (putative recombinase)
MAKTPEGRIKGATTKFLIAEGLCPSKDAANVKIDTAHTGWFHMPVPAFQGVMGQNDYHGHYKGRYFGIETKAPTKDPTPLQQHQIQAINRTGAVSFVVRAVEDLMWVKTWMQKVDKEIESLK